MFQIEDHLTVKDLASITKASASCPSGSLLLKQNGISSPPNPQASLKSLELPVISKWELACLCGRAKVEDQSYEGQYLSALVTTAQTQLVELKDLSYEIVDCSMICKTFPFISPKNLS